MFQMARNILWILTPRERKRGRIVVFLMIGLAAFEVAGIASIMPFLTVMGDPAMIERNGFLNAIYTGLGFETERGFMLALALFGLAVLVAATIVRLMAQYVMTRFVQMRRHSVSRRLLYGHLCQPYEFFLTRNSADLSKTILSEVDQLTQGVIQPAVHLIAYGCVSVAVILFLVVINPIVAASMIAFLGGFYALTYLALRGLLARAGRERVVANGQRFKAAGEAMAGIQELKVLGRERAFFNAFDPASRRFAHHLATVDLLTRLPKRVVEMLGFAAVLGAAIYLLNTHDTLGHVLPILGAYAVAGNRLLPAMQEVYQGMARLRFGRPTVETIMAELNTAARYDPAAEQAVVPLPVKEALTLRGVRYVYPSQTEAALQDIDLTVPAGATVSIHGTTGAGKSTLVKVLLGLLRPSAGTMAVDGLPLDDTNMRRWQRSIGYVPQDIFMVDDTVTANIALGIPREEVDQAAVESAARKARIHTFILERLPQGYDTLIGERGVRLSGGQRQRLAIARALYHRPSVLILDEATSALDPATEAEIVHDLIGRAEDLTLIAITHRETVAEMCSMSYRVERGRLSPAPSTAGSEASAGPETNPVSA